MSDSAPLIQDVSDTSLWVAYYRAKETKRKDALFKDPLAEVLIGERGKKIAESMRSVGENSEWTVIMRTIVIDNYINKLVAEGIDTIVNLGAGLDTRPYRMNLPAALKWIEVDYPNIIHHKQTLLENKKPTCQLSRISLDLSDDKKRKTFLQEIAAQSKKIVVLTEGVVIYLTEKQVADLAVDLNHFPSIAYWIVEYIHPAVYPYLQSPERKEKMQNAPFQFFPADWLSFFKQHGWNQQELVYHGEEGLKLGRPMPLPKKGLLFKLFAQKAILEKTKRASGYLLLRNSNQHLSGPNVSDGQNINSTDI